MRAKANALEPGDYEMIKAIIDTLLFLQQAYDQKTTSVKRLLRMIFGARTEKTKNSFTQLVKQVVGFTLGRDQASIHHRLEVAL
jgi:hypothetical protein